MSSHFNFLFDGMSRIYTESITLKEPFITFASRFAHDFGTVVLISSDNVDCGRYNIMGCEPWLSFHGKHRRMNITVDGRVVEFEADPLDTLKYLLNIYNISDVGFDVPIFSGLMGYLAYDLKGDLETLPSTTIDDSHLPDICFFIPSVIVVQDTLENTTTLFVSSSKRGGITNQRIAINNFNRKLKLSIPQNNFFYGNAKDCNSNLTHDEYVNAVKKIKSYISEGHVYQVNMSQRFDAGFEGDAFTFFKALYDINPAPFFAYINAMGHKVVSTSPERLVMQNKHRVEVRPIKGTRPRGKTMESDELMKNELLNSCKDDAELSMIVDLLRNDLGKVCRSNSINVTEHRRLEAYNNVYHLVSVIEGELDDSNDSIDLIKAVFPGGSITGCPKIRAMEIIDELEVNRRHVYTGSIGYISFHNTMDLSVAIRTATICNNRIRFSVGGGIVYDSDPEDEFKETLHKGQTIMSVFSDNITKKDRYSYSEYMPWAWINGIVKPLSSVNIPVCDLGLMYGFGFFETLRVENRYVHLLREHVHRFNESWRVLFKTPVPDLTWDAVIEQVLEANEVKKKTLIVKIVATRGPGNEKYLFNGSIFIVAKLYKHRVLSNGKEGLKVGIYPKSRQTPLAVHKTLNYLYYHLAGLWAVDNGFDEAIILNPDGTVSEGNSSNIILIYGRDVVLPKSEFVLPGVTISVILKRFKRLRYGIITRFVTPSDLFNADAIFLTNSVMKIVPVVSINNKVINFDPEIVRVLGKVL